MQEIESERNRLPEIPDKWHSKILVGFLIIVGLSATTISIPLLNPDLRPAVKDFTEIVRNVGLGAFGIIAGFAGLYFAYIRSIAARDSAEAALIAARTAQEKEEREGEFTRQVEITSSFTTAIEQLGHNDASVRLGAIHALARVAQQSEKEYWPIMSILAAHIREKSTSNDVDKDRTRAVAFLEIQLCIDILGSRNTEHDPTGIRVDLRGADLREIEFSNAKFSNVRLGKARLNNAVIKDCNFSDCDLSGTDLTSAKLSGTALRNCWAYETVFKDSNLTKCDCLDARFFAAKFENSRIISSDFSGALIFSKFVNTAVRDSHFKGARLSYIEIVNGYFKKVDFSNAIFMRTKWENIKVADCNFTDANFTESNFKETMFWRTLFTGANFGEANFEGCGFSEASLIQASKIPKSVQTSVEIGTVDTIPAY